MVYVFTLCTLQDTIYYIIDYQKVNQIYYIGDVLLFVW